MDLSLREVGEQEGQTSNGVKAPSSHRLKENLRFYLKKEKYVFSCHNRRREISSFPLTPPDF
jgi:hypothetical protein